MRADLYRGASTGTFTSPAAERRALVVVDMLPTLNSSVSSWSSRFERAASCSCTATDELTAGEA